MIDSLLRTVTLGPLSLPLIVLPLLLTFITYPLLIRFFYRGREELLEATDKVLFNSLFLLLIIWKLSPLVFQFSTVIKNPSAVLYLSGGGPGVLLGVISVFIYVLRTVFKKKNGRGDLIKSFGINLSLLFLCAALLVAGAGLMANLMIEADPASSSAAPGMYAPDFTLEGEDGNLYSLSDYSGKTVVLNFWASWCPPCRAEMPELKNFYDGLESDNTVFLSINLFSMQRDPAQLATYLKEEALEFPLLYDRNGEVSSDYGVVSIPTTVIINPEGEIIAVKNGAVTEAWLKRAVK